MARSDFNRELERYLAARGEKKDWSLFVTKHKKKPEPVPENLKDDEVQVIDEPRRGFWERLFGGARSEALVSEDLTEEEMARLERMKREIDEVEEAEREHPEFREELEEERETLLERFFSFFRLAERRHKLEEKAAELDYLEEHVEPRMDEDVKRVLRIVHRWLGKLSKRQRDAFKKSADFAEYKALLEKYGVAKKSSDLKD
ncbi:hypothetical protein D6789_02935 [Candidatus Woesearchaeota archaeon]|nr:MAG: hypothetical protein D6789_02935 [Candidatus Woesearchaeota archaeon]